MSQTAIEALLLYCRAGFEKECAQEITQAAEDQGVSGWCKAVPDSGYVLFHPAQASDLAILQKRLKFSALCFARQMVWVGGPLRLAAENRLPPLVDAARALPGPFSCLWLETADTNEAKELSGFCRKFEPHLNKALAGAGLLKPENARLARSLSDLSDRSEPDGRARPVLRDFEAHSQAMQRGIGEKWTALPTGAVDQPQGRQAPRLHVFFLDSTTAYAGISRPGNSSNWPMGIPRLKMPREAPSRSTLKLAEALLEMLGEQERAQLRPGRRAVDLGASPGGWTWQLVNRGMKVTAVDNGPMDPALMEGELVEHLRADGFTFRPRHPVDWLVCDMVDKPARVLDLVARWFERGDCRAAIFNLKLPMKRRFEEVELARAILQQRLSRLDGNWRIAVRQLYHDREEVTVCVLPEAG